MCIDTSTAPDERVGNERKLQETWQAYPVRPQHFFIIGASPTKRLFINALLKVVATFSSSKVIQRLRFVEVCPHSTDSLDVWRIPRASVSPRFGCPSLWRPRPDCPVL